MSSNYPPFGNVPARPCQRCGRPLPPNEAYCANCGFMNTPAQPNNSSTQSPSGSGMAWGGGVPQQSFGSGQQWGQPPQSQQPQQPQQSPRPAQNNPFNNSGVPQPSFGSPNSPNTGTNPFYGSSNSQSPTTNSFFGSSVPQQSLYSQQSSAPTTGTFQNGNPNGAINGFAASSGFAQPPQAGFPPNNMSGFASSGFVQQPQPQSPTTGEFTPPPHMNTFQAGGFTQSPPMNGYSQPFPGQSQPLQPVQPVQFPKRKRRPKVGRIIAVLVLLILVVGGSIGGYFYLAHHKTTATVQATPTMQPTPTPTGKTLFNDTFANNNNGWDLTTKPGEFSVKVGGGSMVLEDDNNKLLWELVPGNKNFSDFYMTVDATLSKGTQSNGYGIYIRGASNQTIDIATYYRFEMYGDGTFAIFKGSVDAAGVSSSSILVTYTNSTVIQKQGRVNHIAINASGSKLTFYVNGQVIKIVNDNTYNTGSIALFVSNLQHTTPGAQATFANLSIYPPQH